MAAELRSTVEGRTMVLTISNPEHRNALGPEMYAAGVEALNNAETNPVVRCVVLTGEGETFCAGAAPSVCHCCMKKAEIYKKQASSPRGTSAGSYL